MHKVVFNSNTFYLNDSALDRFLKFYLQNNCCTKCNTQNISKQETHNEVNL